MVRWKKTVDFFGTPRRRLRHQCPLKKKQKKTQKKSSSIIAGISQNKNTLLPLFTIEIKPAKKTSIPAEKRTPKLSLRYPVNWTGSKTEAKGMTEKTFVTASKVKELEPWSVGGLPSWTVTGSAGNPLRGSHQVRSYGVSLLLMPVYFIFTRKKGKGKANMWRNMPATYGAQEVCIARWIVVHRELSRCILRKTCHDLWRIFGYGPGERVGVFPPAFCSLRVHIDAGWRRLSSRSTSHRRTSRDRCLGRVLVAEMLLPFSVSVGLR